MTFLTQISVGFCFPDLCLNILMLNPQTSFLHRISIILWIFFLILFLPLITLFQIGSNPSRLRKPNLLFFLSSTGVKKMFLVENLLLGLGYGVSRLAAVF